MIKLLLLTWEKNEENLKIVRTVISLAEDLGVQVTAEGIETSHHLHLLRQFSWITGPSRTADIDGILIQGAHGPKKLFVLVFE